MPCLLQEAESGVVSLCWACTGLCHLRPPLPLCSLQPSLCYQDLHSALLLNPKHLQARQLLQKMVEQAQQARYDAGILAVQGKLQHALLCISCAIENNPLDPSFFLFRYCPSLQTGSMVSRQCLTSPRPQHAPAGL